MIIDEDGVEVKQNTVLQALQLKKPPEGFDFKRLLGRAIHVEGWGLRVFILKYCSPFNCEVQTVESRKKFYIPYRHICLRPADEGLLTGVEVSSERKTTKRKPRKMFSIYVPGYWRDAILVKKLSSAKQQPSLAEMQDFVEGPIERVKVYDADFLNIPEIGRVVKEAVLICNEEGALINFEANINCRATEYAGFTVYGNAIFFIGFDLA